MSCSSGWLHTYSHKDDDDVKKCLDIRYDPTWSINAAANYGNDNLKILTNKGFKLNGLNDMDKAKLMYLMHHGGSAAGPHFITNTLASLKGGTVHLKHVFVTQFGTDGVKQVEELIDRADGDVEIAYRLWLASFIDTHFEGASKYFCSSPAEMHSVNEIIKTIGGEKVTKL